jgi:hypothetical protein
MEIINLFLFMGISYFIRFFSTYQIIFSFFILSVSINYIMDNLIPTQNFIVTDYINDIKKIDNKFINYITNYIYEKLVSINDSYVKGRSVIIKYGIDNTYSIFLPPLTQTNPLLAGMMSLNNITKLTSLNNIKPVMNIKPVNNIKPVINIKPHNNIKPDITNIDNIKPVINIKPHNNIKPDITNIDNNLDNILNDASLENNKVFKQHNNIKPVITNIDNNLDNILDDTSLVNNKVFKTNEDMIHFLDNLTY